MASNRKQELLALLKGAKEAMNGQSLAEHRGYIYKSREDDSYVRRLFKVNHKVSDMEDELLAIVDNGGRIQNIMIDHPVYGEIQTLLKLTCRRDVSHFLDQASSNDFRPLSDLTNGVHYHLVEADSEQDIDYIEEALNHLGFLVKE